MLVNVSDLPTNMAPMACANIHRQIECKLRICEHTQVRFTKRSDCEYTKKYMCAINDLLVSTKVLYTKLCMLFMYEHSTTRTRTCVCHAS